MHHRRSIHAALLVAVCLAGTATPSLAQSVDEDVTAAYAAWDAAFNAGDAAALAAIYSEDALFLPATHDVIAGPDDVQAFFAARFEMGVTGHELELIEAHEVGDAVVAAARWSADGKDASGADQPWGGIATHVFEREDSGELKLRLHTFN